MTSTTHDAKETHVVRMILREGVTVPEYLTHNVPFHIHYRDDGELEVFWLVNNNLRHVK